MAPQDRSVAWCCTGPQRGEDCHALLPHAGELVFEAREELHKRTGARLGGCRDPLAFMRQSGSQDVHVEEGGTCMFCQMAAGRCM